MSKKQKLELTWIGKDEQAVLEPRILIEDPERSYGDPHSENMLIHGDNLLALKALEQKFAGKVKCIYIDPPYNTGSAFTHYEDGLEHSLWLSLIRDRLVVLRNLLSDDGSLWISIDDNESHYLKVLCDEVFERRNFVANVIWQKRTSPDARLGLGAAHDSILVYGRAADKTHTFFNRLVLTEEQKAKYKNPDNDPRGPWVSTDFTAQGYRPNQMYKITTDAGVEYDPPDNRCWANIEDGFNSLRADNRIWFGEHGRNRPRIKNFLRDAQGIRCWTWWPKEEVGHNQESKKEINALFGASNPFDTPKPERLIERIIHVATNPGDFVLDSFLGSGTAVAVAHKMGRKWIGIELGDHCDTHCLPRLQQVCDGTDQGGISEAVEWEGGGGFKYYDLAPSLLKQDKHGNYVISEEYNADMLAAAMAKQQGFTFCPDQELYWKQGFSTEQDFIFTTTGHVTAAMLDTIAEEMAEGEHLLICCKKFDKACDGRHVNIQVKKIPQVLMGRCEFGKEDYSLNIVNLTDEENAPEFVPEGPVTEDRGRKSARKRGNLNPEQQELF